jgi:hypothetical protein
MAAQFDLTAVARRLLNIEVNTIVRDSMTGESMPLVPHALLDIAGEYAQMLCALGVDLPKYFQAGTHLQELEPGWVTPPPAVLRNELTISVETFDRLRWAAKWAAAARKPHPIDPADEALLQRIINNSDTIKEMFKRFSPSFNQLFLGKTRAELLLMQLQAGSYAVPPDDLALLQKIWDIGIEQIVAQTIVHVTGDVTTRVQSVLLTSGSQTLLDIHRQSIDVSVRCWSFLLKAVSDIAGTTVKTLLGTWR